MRYKIESFFHETFYIYNKADLFDFIDIYTRRNPFFSVFSDRFDISYEGGFFVEVEKEVCNDYGYYYKINKYVKSLFIIKDENNFVIDYSKLYDEYKESRNIKPYRSKYKYRDRSTSKYRRSRGYDKYIVSKHSYKKEYTDMLISEEMGVSIRAKRKNDVKSKFVTYYGDDYGFRPHNKSWKSKKVKRQWQKHIK